VLRQPASYGKKVSFCAFFPSQSDSTIIKVQSAHALGFDIEKAAN